MGFLSSLARAVSAVATGGASEIARAAAKAAGLHKQVRTAETIVGASTIEAAKGFASGLVAGGIKGAIVGAVGSAALTTAQLAHAALTPVRVTPVIRTSIARATPRPIDVPRSGAGFFVPAFGQFTPFETTGGNPAWRSLGHQAVSFQPFSGQSGGFWEEQSADWPTWQAG